MSIIENGPASAPAMPGGRKDDGNRRKIRDSYTQEAKAGAFFANKFSPADETAPNGYFGGRPILGRHSPRINGGVDYVGNPNELAIIVDDSLDPILSRVYSQLQDRLSKDKQSFLKPRKGVLETVYTVTKKVLPYHLKQEVAFDKKQLENGYDTTYLGHYIKNKAGVCRQQALLAGYLLEKLIDDNVISGNVHINRQLVGKNGHQWVRWETPDGKVIILDPAQRFIGSIERSKWRLPGFWKHYDIDVKKPETQTYTGVSQATSFEELYQSLGKMDGIQGSNDYFTRDMLFVLIEDVRAGKRKISSITNGEGLRDKVIELLDQ